MHNAVDSPSAGGDFHNPATATDQRVSTMTHTKYDLIGDIHGHADELCRLLQKLGYTRADDGFRHSERQVIFLGDFIDRGPKIRETLDIVRAMMEDGQALAVMGNHEFNALAFHTTLPNRDDQSLRPRSSKNIRQHVQTLAQLKDSQLADALEWFAKLPMWLDLEGLRAVHACWDENCMARIDAALRVCGGVSHAFLLEACTYSSPLHEAVEIVLKGKELELPAGAFFVDKDGHRRTSIRTKWFTAPAATYEEYALQSDKIECDVAIPYGTPPILSREAYVPYPASAPPVFVGHYWLHADVPSRLASNVACLDYSVAKGGFLCAYRWDGEQEIDNSKFVASK